MKSYKFILPILILVLSLTSCEDYFGEDSNVDPDNPTEATLQVILPQVQARLAYTFGGDFTRYIGIYSQQVDGVNRQFVVYQNYGMVQADTDNMWSNMFVGTMNNNRAMIDNATEAGHNHFAGVGKLIEAYAMMLTTDYFGDVPYSDAFRFNEIGLYSPTFDAQESIYSSILSLITEAKSNLAADDGGNPVGGEDLIYGGDISKWTKFANVLEARANLHLTNNGTSSYSDVLASLDKGGFENSGDDFGFQFGSNASETAPFYQYIEQRDDCEVGATLTDLLTSLSDPRIDTYGATHDLPHPIFTRDQFLKMVSYTEQMFMMAEASLDSDADAAYNAFVAGVTSSFIEAGLDAAAAETYITDQLPSDGSSLTLEDIITQKYIGLYTNPEVFSDWRRTGVPELEPNSGSAIPRRLPYSEVEQLANENCPTPSEYSIYDRVWWDE